MLAEEQRLLDERLAQNDGRAAWVRWMVIAGSALAVLTMLWASPPPEPGMVALLRDRGRAAGPGAAPPPPSTASVRASRCSGPSASSRTGTSASRCCSTCRRPCSGRAPPTAPSSSTPANPAAPRWRPRTSPPRQPESTRGGHLRARARDDATTWRSVAPRCRTAVFVPDHLGHDQACPGRGRAARGSEDAGGRTTDRRHRARFQQPAAGHPREPGVRPGQARRRRKAAATDRARGVGGPARRDPDGPTPRLRGASNRSPRRPSTSPRRCRT